MNISPRNQTLILASERRGQGDQTHAGNLSRALDAASNGGILRRLTIVAARPDDELVYVQADYAIPGERADPPRDVLVTTPHDATGGRDAHGNALTQARSNLSYQLRAVEQYAQTQRNGTFAASVGLDVHA